MRLSDKVTGLFIAGLGCAAAYGGSLLPPVPGQEVGPNVFPMVIGLGLAACGTMIALGIGHKFEEDAEAELLAIEGPPPEPETKSPFAGLRVLIPPALLVFYVLAVDRLGFLLTAAIMAFTIAKTLGARLQLAIPVALLAPIGGYLIFAKLLRVPLPDGFLPMPW
ncbi:tripartite tricarboxylate transporter TctB [Afipia sp. Root123D2]|uniref:tripartite tricarboxylate transporter TctB family protein n=1 Tax=Afipia sp. Root123D2 TaxID=1736436 RepID=UPI000700DDEE|nr:tripartite tricarboxylate transporter TctB family protein [Afipia sp. Root123D2]KQW18511.1 tripartite tricarboxylate transporter TctB [Afipia sp. Root123D2]